MSHNRLSLEGLGMKALALKKGREKYIFLYTNDYRSQLIEILGTFAENSELSFTDYDAAFLSSRIRKIYEEEREAALKQASRSDEPEDPL
jgi:hypothetical protein